MIRRPPRSTQSRSSAASDVYKRQIPTLLRLHQLNFLILPGDLLLHIAPLQIPHRGDSSLVLLHRSNPLDPFLSQLLFPHPQLQRVRTSAFLHHNGSPVIYLLLLLSTQLGSRSQRQLPVLLLNSQRAKAVFLLQSHPLLPGNGHPYQSHIQPVIQE